MAAFKNNATLTFNGHSVLSNTVTGEITDVLTGSKTAPVDVLFSSFSDFDGIDEQFINGVVGAKHQTIAASGEHVEIE